LAKAVIAEWLSRHHSKYEPRFGIGQGRSCVKAARVQGRSMTMGGLTAFWSGPAGVYTRKEWCSWSNAGCGWFLMVLVGIKLAASG